MPASRSNAEIRSPTLASRLGQILGFVAANHVWTRLLVMPTTGDGAPSAIGPGLVVSTIGLAALEEGIFRGLLFAWLRQRFGVTAAIIGSALLFAAFHAPPRTAVVALLLGLQLGALRQAHGLGLTVAAHVTSNLALLVLAAFPSARPSDDPLVFVAASAVAGSALAGLAQRLRNTRD